MKRTMVWGKTNMKKPTGPPTPLERRLHAYAQRIVRRLHALKPALRAAVSRDVYAAMIMRFMFGPLGLPSTGVSEAASLRLLDGTETASSAAGAAAAPTTRPDAPSAPPLRSRSTSCGRILAA